MGSKTFMEDLELNKNKMLYPVRMKKNEIRHRKFYQLGGGEDTFGFTYNGFDFLDKAVGQGILTRMRGLGLNM